ncbi:UDP-2,3-diacylglucosamine diphosphatase [Aquabacterium sp.]|uniref:UDP-2,3-diacylglucosamine diphosphatase n=1 Tax=Aquabacterium sp. TaxID=1872578 RepID=UPI002BA731B9|nr:UDP-2,3-diacylglucosamine diphosphatase [Aquabacterium sp.]HSW04541.1 UDP-2,3-diacylglucosamine diphosphatase [Aquabacterium sp.]
MTPIAEWRADPRWSAIDLLSDVHLHADMPRTFDVWRQHLLDTPADAVLMLGDVFEVWVGDDARLDAFEQQCCEVLRQATARRSVAFLPGNRDFLVGDVMLQACGVQRLADPTLLRAWQHRLLLTHGDALCLADVDYQRFRQEVRGADWQQRFLAQPLAERQRQARAMRDASAAHQAAMVPGQWFDVDGAAADAWLAAADADMMVHGHTHRPAVHTLPSGKPRHVLGDWDLDAAAPRARALRLTAQGLAVLDLAAR